MGMGGGLRKGAGPGEMHRQAGREGRAGRGGLKSGQGGLN
jgi:hypothetical protein